MDITVIKDLISNLGFPILCVIVMFWMWNKEREDHKAESDKWCDALNNNTSAITKLTEYLTNK